MSRPDARRDVDRRSAPARREERPGGDRDVDAVFGLSQLLEHTEMALARHRRRDTGMAALVIDVGDDVDDATVSMLTRRLRGSVRAGDIVARLREAELVVVCEDLGSGESATAIARRVLDELDRPLIMGASRRQVVAHAGVAAFSTADEDAESLLNRAEQAAYVARTRDDHLMVAPRPSDDTTEAPPRPAVEAGDRPGGASASDNPQ